MTGWQGNEGGWGRQGGPHGQDPSQAPAAPHWAHQTGGFPAQGYGPPPPPPGRSKLPMVLGVLAIVIIVGAVVAIVLVNRDSGGSPTAAPTAASTSSAEPTSAPRSAPPTSEGPDTRDGWQAVDNVADSGLTYEVPPEWELVPTARPSGLGVDFSGTADYGDYRCEDGTYIRGFASSGDVQGKDGADLELAKTVKDFAASFATTYFKDTARVEVPEPTETEVDGRPAATLTATVTPKVTVPACEATEGEIAIVGVRLAEEGKPAGVAMLVVVSDVAGGPEDPEPLPRSVAQEVLASVSVG